MSQVSKRRNDLHTTGSIHDCLFSLSSYCDNKSLGTAFNRQAYVDLQKPHNYREQEQELSLPSTLTTLTTHFLCLPTCLNLENTYINSFSLISAGKWVKAGGNTGWLSKNKSTHSRFENEGTRSLLLKRHLTQLEDERFPRGWRNIFIDVIEGFPRKKIITGTNSCKWNRVFNWRTEQVHSW